MCQVHLVGVHRKNLRLRVAALDLQREQNFLHFAAEAAVAAVEEKISGQLHRDGAGPAGDAALDDVADCGAEHARKVDAPVLFEVLVLDGGDGVVQHFRTLLISHQDAALQREAAGEQRDAVNQFPAAQAQRDRWQGQHRKNTLSQKSNIRLRSVRTVFRNIFRRRRSGRGCGRSLPLHV